MKPETLPRAPGVDYSALLLQTTSDVKNNPKNSAVNGLTEEGRAKAVDALTRGPLSREGDTLID